MVEKMHKVAPFSRLRVITIARPTIMSYSTKGYGSAVPAVPIQQSQQPKNNATSHERAKQETIFPDSPPSSPQFIPKQRENEDEQAYIKRCLKLNPDEAPQMHWSGSSLKYWTEEDAYRDFVPEEKGKEVEMEKEKEKRDVKEGEEKEKEEEHEHHHHRHVVKGSEVDEEFDESEVGPDPENQFIG